MQRDEFNQQRDAEFCMRGGRGQRRDLPGQQVIEEREEEADRNQYDHQFGRDPAPLEKADRSADDEQRENDIADELVNKLRLPQRMIQTLARYSQQTPPRAEIEPQCRREVICHLP